MLAAIETGHATLPLVYVLVFCAGVVSAFRRTIAPIAAAPALVPRSLSPAP